MEMYVEQDHALNLRKVHLEVQDTAIVATGSTKNYRGTKTIPFADITALEYEKSKHRRWKTGILLSPIFLLSSGKKHWFAVIVGEDETVFQLDKSNFQLILSGVENATGKKVDMVASRGK